MRIDATQITEVFMREDEHNAHIDKAEQEFNRLVLRTRSENQKRKREEEQHEHPDREWKVYELIELRKEFLRVRDRQFGLFGLIMGTLIYLIWHIIVGH